MMGAGIAYACAKRRRSTSCSRTSRIEAAERGKAYSREALDKAVARGRTTAEKRDACLARITPTDDLPTWPAATWSSRRCSRTSALKQEVFAEVGGDRRRRTRCSPPTRRRCRSPSLGRRRAAARRTSSGCTSSRRWTRCRWSRSCAGEQTSDAALARGLRPGARRSARRRSWSTTRRGFFTSGSSARSCMEGVALLAEGVPAASDRAGRAAGRLPGRAAGGARRGDA